MIKKFNSFIRESYSVNQKMIGLSSEERNLFRDNPLLVSLIEKNKIKIVDNNLYYDPSDDDLIDILSQYLKIN